MASVVSLTPQQEQEVFTHWAIGTPEPTLQNLPDLKRERKQFYRLSEYIKTSTALCQYQILVAKKILEFSACRLLRFDTLPDDVILHIFRQGVFYSPENRDASLMALLYSKVCQRWRTLTLAASWLWSFVVFPDNHPPYSLTRVYLERSRLASLIIEINITNTRFDPDDDALWPAENHLEGRMSLLLPHAHRWSSFSCNTDNWAPLSHVIKKFSTVELPSLKDLEFIQNFSDTGDYPFPNPFSFIMATSAPPRLEKLRLIGLSLNWKHLSELHLNLSELVVHKIPDWGLLPFMEDFYGIILSTSTNLRKLSLAGISFFWDPIESPPPAILHPIHLPNLEEFAFQAGSDDDGFMVGDLEYLTYLLTMFNFGPNLRCVSLSLSRFSEDPHIDQFVPTLGSKFGRIEHFSIGNVAMTVAQLTSWLTVLPNLTSLAMLCDIIQPTVYATLTYSPILCPLLHTLYPHNPHDGLIFIVVNARLDAGKPLRHIVWDINDRETVEQCIRYQSLKRLVDIAYQGEYIDPNDLWIGPNGEYAGVDVRLLT